MPLLIPKNVLEAAVGGGQIKRYRDFAVVFFDGEGAICVPNDVWLPAAAWATSRKPSGNRLRDRVMLLQRLDMLVTRRGTAMISTTGAHLRLARLRDLMKRDGLDVKEWNFPPDEVLNQALNVQPDVPNKDKDVAESEESAVPSSPGRDARAEPSDPAPRE